MDIVHGSEQREGRLSDLVTRVRDTIRRRWLTLVIVSGVVFALGVALTFVMTPQYAATARVRLDPTRNPLAAGTDQQAALSAEAIDTEVTLLSSLDIARKVVNQLGLGNDPQFTKHIDSGDTGPHTPAERETAVANAVLTHLSVSREKLTYILAVRFTGPDPVQSANIANAFVKTYIDSKVGSRVGTAERQAQFFRQRLDALGKEANAADAQVAQYRARAGIVEGGGAGGTQGTITDQQVAPLSSQLATAASDAAAAHANLAAAQRQVSHGGIDSVSEVLQSQVIADLRRQRAEVVRNMAEVQARYGERHPESIRVHDQLAGIDAQLREESDRVVGALRATAAAADARVASLRGAMNRLEGEQAANTRNSVMADSLQRDAAAKRAQYDKLSQMSLESTQSTQNQISQAEVIEVAQPPIKPSSPDKPLFILAALVFGLASGMGTIGTQEMMVRGMRTGDELRAKLDLPLLAAIPRVPRMANPADLLLEKPTSLFAESLRNARASIVGVRNAKPPRVIAITSALPSEGKTTTALAFARTMAINNGRTLILECDVRRAALSNVLEEVGKGAGLVELLNDEATLDQAIAPSTVEGLDQLLVRTPYFSSGDLFGNGRMEQLLQELRDRYEYVVMDLPPLVGLADGRFLAVLADTSVLCVRWDSTPPAAAQAALRSLQADGATVAGAVFTMVDPSAEAIGGLYYSKKYTSYYQAS